MTVAALISEIKQGSRAAQECLFVRLSGPMLAVCERYLKNRQDAEERMLDGFYKFFTSIHRFQYQNDETLYAWLKQIMVNECLMQLRKKHVLSVVPETALAETPATDDLLAGISAAEIYQLILQLPVGYRTVFNLYEVEGYEHKEIACLLGIAESTSKSQLSRAKSLLQKMIFSNNRTTYEQQCK